MCIKKRSEWCADSSAPSFSSAVWANSFRCACAGNESDEILASQRCVTPFTGNAYIRLLNRFSVKGVVTSRLRSGHGQEEGPLVQDAASCAVAHQGGDRNRLPRAPDPELRRSPPAPSAAPGLTAEGGQARRRGRGVPGRALGRRS